MADPTMSLGILDTLGRQRISDDSPCKARILLLSYAFPPIQVPMAPVATKLAVGLAKLGCHVHVVCGPPLEPRLDASLLPYARQNAASIRQISFNGWKRILSRLQERVGVHKDEMHFLRGHMTDIVQKLLVNNYTAVLTLSPFHSINLIMTSLKKRHPNIRWIAQFSDPWAGNPLETSSVRREAWSRDHEVRTVRAADRLVFTSAPARDLMLSGLDDHYYAKTVIV